jgi:hypothetical protein
MDQQSEIRRKHVNSIPNTAATAAADDGGHRSLNILILFSSVIALYLLGYQDGRIPRLGLLLSLCGGLSLTNWMAIAKADVGRVYRIPAFHRRFALTAAFSGVSVLVAVLIYLPHASIGYPEPFLSIYSNTYTSWAKPIAHIVWYSCLWSLPFSAIVHTYTGTSGGPQARSSFRAGAILAAVSYAALWEPSMLVAMWGLIRFWRNGRRLYMPADPGDTR